MMVNSLGDFHVSAFLGCYDISAVDPTLLELAYTVTAEPNKLYMCVESCRARNKPVAGLTGLWFVPSF